MNPPILSAPPRSSAVSAPSAPSPRTPALVTRASLLTWVLLAGGLALTGCSRSTGPSRAGESDAGTADAGRPVVRISIATVRVSEEPLPTEVVGTVRPAERALVAPKLMGAIESLPVTLGQRVAAGEVLARISAAEILARVTQARAQLNLAQRDLDRERSLLTQGASTADLVRSLEDRATMTVAMVREAEVMLGYAEIRAPFTGVVVRKMAQTGDFASPGFPLLELEGTSDFQIEANLPESLAARLSVGSAIPAVAPSSGASFSAVLTELSPSADAAARTVPVKLSVPAGTAVRSGEFVRLSVPGPVVRRLSVPAAAVSVLGQMERVFVLATAPAGTGSGAAAPAEASARSGRDLGAATSASDTAAAGPRATLRLVRTGVALPEGFVEILAGLEVGERVVLNPPASLREGDRLEVLP
ncbi:MAG: efflux RND transporter periplasmic adaptor subunit [Verrucomicrobia bacterium]|nr:efflux RND transporter periplasmic adaptor subunit [Verrucomicrobiota bacterium]